MVDNALLDRSTGTSLARKIGGPPTGERKDEEAQDQRNNDSRKEEGSP